MSSLQDHHKLLHSVKHSTYCYGQRASLVINLETGDTEELVKFKQSSLLFKSCSIPKECNREEMKNNLMNTEVVITLFTEIHF